MAGDPAQPISLSTTSHSHFSPSVTLEVNPKGTRWARMMSEREVLDIVEALGHTAPALAETPGGRWYGECSCGFRTTTRRTPHDAVGGLLHHARLIVQRHAANGADLPRRRAG